jgi:hypothetical protein
MPRRLLLILVGAALGLAAPASASAAVEWHCAATPLSGTVLGQPLAVPSLDEACANASTATTLALPAALSSLLSADTVSGITAVQGAGAYAGAGLAHLKVGSIPVTLPKISVPASLTKIPISIAGLPVATVDLTPAIDAINSLPSKDLLDAGVLYSTVFAGCQNSQDAIVGASKLADASVLGLPVDASQTVDSSVNLLDTTNIALSSLDLSLAKVTLLVGVLNVNTSQVLDALKPVVASLPPISVPAQAAEVKLTPSTQTTSGGTLTQRALRVQISVAGTSIADLEVGRAAIGGGGCAAPNQPHTAPEAALQCTSRKVALIDVLRRGGHVHLYGAADKSLAGKSVSIVFAATHRVVARVTVGADGAFSTTAPLPPAGVRDTNRARYVARVGREKSLNLKLRRRMVVDQVRSHDDEVTITGRVIGALGKPIQPIVLKRRVSCHRLQTVARFKPRRDGEFSVTVVKPKGLTATVYRLQTKVRETRSNPRLYPTFTLPRAVDL